MRDAMLGMIDFDKIQNLFNDFYTITNLPVVILDLDGNILARTQWQPLCGTFHRMHPDTAERCRESDTILANKMDAGEQYHVYKCLNGLNDVVVPLVVKDTHIANLYTGQFFFEPPDRDFFKKQAETYGFDEKEYMAALDKVPLVSQKEIDNVMAFLSKMTLQISEMTVQKIEQSRLIAQLKHNEETITAANQQLRANEQQLRAANEQLQENHIELEEAVKNTQFWSDIVLNATVGVAVGYPDGRMGKCNDAYAALTGYTQQELQKINWNSVLTPPQWLDAEMTKLQELQESKQSVTYEKEYIRKDGSRIPVELTVHPGVNDAGEITHYIAFVKDVSDRIEKQREIARAYESIQLANQQLQASEEELRASNQQLAANEQQLKANEIELKNQLKKSERQRKANVIVLRDLSSATSKLMTEINQRKKAEEELRRKEVLLRASVESPIDVIILSLDREYRYLYFNKAHRNVMKAAYNKEPEIGKCIFDYMTNEEDIKQIKAIYDRGLQGQRTVTEESYGEKERRFYQIHINPILDENEAVIGVTSFSQDVSEKKKAAEALEESEERYRELVNTVNSGIAIYKVINEGSSGSDYIIQDFNKYALEHERLEREQVIGKCLKDIRPKIDEYGLIDIFREVWKTGNPASFPVKIYEDEKYSNYYENRVFKLPSGEIVAVYDDVTDRETARLKLEVSEATFRSYVDNAPVGIFITDEKGRYVDVNPAASKITGYSRKELLTLSIPDLLPGTNHEVNMRNFEELKKRGSLRFQKSYFTRSGEERYWEISSVKLSENRFLGFTKDITEQKKAQDEIVKTQADMRSLLENSGISFVLMNTNMTIRAFNDKAKLNAEKVFGKEIKIGESMLDYTLSGNREGFLHDFGECLIGKTVKVDMGFPLEEPELWFNFSYDPVKDDNGKVVGVLFSTLDITERKKAEQALQESEERFQIAMNASNDGLFDWNLETNESYYSPGWKRMIGYQDHELPNDFSVWETTTKPEDVKKSWKMQQKLISQEIDRFVMELKMKHKDGHWVEVLARAKAIFNEEGKAIRIVGTHVDISDRKKAEKELKNTLEATTDGIWSWNFKDDGLHFSPKYYTMLGYEPNEFEATYSNWVNLIHPDDRAEAVKVAEKYLAKKVDTYENEYRVKTKDGDYRWIRTKGRVVERDEYGNALYMIGNHEDVTERKKNEEKIKQDLEERNVLIKELYHRTKNNMQIIMSLLAMHDRKCKNSEMKEIMKDVGGKVKSMALVHQKLYQSKDLSRLNLKDYIHDLIEQLHSSFTIADRHILVRYDLIDVFVSLDDATPLGLVINELVTNAFKYAWPNRESGTLKVRLCRKQDGRIVLEIADDGVGLDDNFDLKKDSNLGLTLVNMLSVRQLEGELNFSNEQGVTWSLTFNKDLYTTRI